MQNTLLIPKHTRVFPTEKSRTHAANINYQFGPSDFDSYNDWFYFIHIDPIQRIIHAIGMVIGSIMYLIMLYEWSLWSIIYYFIGTFFFYILGVISHIIYDKGTARSEGKYIITTFWPVIRINLLTITKKYDHDLREFVKKYPFVKDAHELIELDRDKVFTYLLRRT